MPSRFSNAICLQTDQAKNFINEQNVLPIFVGSLEAFLHSHIPGAVHISPSQLVCGIAPAVGKIPDEDDLSLLMSNLGINKDTVIIAYDDEGGGWAGRLIWTLDVIGHKHYHFLDGGITAWLADGLPLSQTSTTIKTTNYTALIDHQQLINANQIIEKLGQPDFAIWDARSVEEYEGSRVSAAKNGHIPGAINIDWLALMDRTNSLRLKPLNEIKDMLDEKGLTSDKHIVTHCQTHHRSGLTYITGKILGLNIQAYDGSWSEWGNLDNAPVETSL